MAKTRLTSHVVRLTSHVSTALFVLILAPRTAHSIQTPTPAFSAALYSAQHSGDAVLVFHHDSLLLEQYQNGYDSSSPHPLASGTKTFACVLAALGQADKLLTLDEPVARTLPEFAADSALKRISIRQLLNLTSGLAVDPGGRGLTLASRPGQRFAYGGTSFAVFGMVMSRKLKGEDLLAYLTRRVFTPLGISAPVWQRDGAGNPGLASGAAMTARDWGRLGVLLLQRGRWKGRQLIPSAPLAECGRGSEANPYYGLGVWLNPAPSTRPAPAGVERAGKSDHTIDATDLPHDLLMAAGTGGQRLYILPAFGLVVVRFGHNTGPDYRDDVFLRTLLAR
jgi:CubicO group peptidase (beta-lactamase class C family)